VAARASLRPVPVAGLTLDRVRAPDEQRADGGAGTALAGLQRAHDRFAGPPTGGGLVVRRTFQDYTDAYDAAYPGSFWEGFRDGLDELVDERVIQQGLVRQIENNHNMVIQYPPGWDAEFNVRDRPRYHREFGAAEGVGVGFDQGYDDAITLYGYARKYSAMNPLDRQVALQDNGGMCVYCNAAPCADVDHIEPLKVHWQSGGAMQGLAQRSQEANDLRNLVGTCVNCNRSKGSRRLKIGWNPPDPAWAGAGTWWPFGPARVVAGNSPPPYW
jgi:hypothetical protein